MAQLAVNKMTMVNVMKGLMLLHAGIVRRSGLRLRDHADPVESKIVPITTFTQVAGKWEGLSKRMPDMRDHAQVVMIINENGHFNFISDQTGSGLFLGTGTLTIHERPSFGNQWQWDRHHDAS